MKKQDKRASGSEADEARTDEEAKTEKARTESGEDAAPQTGSGDGGASLQAERDKLEDQLRRAMADLANMRKRQAKDREDARQRAVEAIAAELLPVLDNFHLALSAQEQVSEEASAEVKNMFDGLVMVRSLLEGTLERHGVAEISAEGQVFDPNRHEAVGVEPSPDAREGTIVRVVQRGYMLGDKVLRASRVVVAGESQADAGDS